MTEENALFNNKKVLFVGKPFILGKCRCGKCNEDIEIRNSRGCLKRFTHGHNRPNLGKHLGKNGNGRFLHDGYWRIYKPDYFSSLDNGVVSEHIYIYQEFHKLCMLPWGDIHHIDEKPTEENANRIENLQGMTKSNHITLHWKLRREKKKGLGLVWDFSQTNPLYF